MDLMIAIDPLIGRPRMSSLPSPSSSSWHWEAHLGGNWTVERRHSNPRAQISWKKQFLHVKWSVLLFWMRSLHNKRWKVTCHCNSQTPWWDHLYSTFDQSSNSSRSSPRPLSHRTAVRREICEPLLLQQIHLFGFFYNKKYLRLSSKPTTNPTFSLWSFWLELKDTLMCVTL